MRGKVAAASVVAAEERCGRHDLVVREDLRTFNRASGEK